MYGNACGVRLERDGATHIRVEHAHARDQVRVLACARCLVAPCAMRDLNDVPYASERKMIRRSLSQLPFRSL
jgi:hypothetical protein